MATNETINYLTEMGFTKEKSFVYFVTIFSCYKISLCSGQGRNEHTVIGGGGV